MNQTNNQSINRPGINIFCVLSSFPLSLSNTPNVITTATAAINQLQLMPHPYPSYLHTRDRYSMAQVCRTWREASLNPGLWRTHVFYLYCQHEVPQGRVWLAGRADFLRHATVMCFGAFDKPREEFLRAMQQADLLDLDINGAAYWWSAAPDGLYTLCG